MELSDLSIRAFIYLHVIYICTYKILSIVPMHQVFIY